MIMQMPPVWKWTFWGEISDWKALQTTVRQYLICSCSQHSAAERMELDKILQDQILQTD
jgi:hypothetical protein